MKHNPIPTKSSLQIIKETRSEKIPPATASAIVIAYDLVRAGTQIIIDVMADRDTPAIVRDALPHTSLPLKEAVRRLEKHVGGQQKGLFEQQVKSVDPYTLANILELFSYMTPEQKAQLELAAIGIKKGEIVFTQDAS